MNEIVGRIGDRAFSAHRVMGLLLMEMRPAPSADLHKFLYEHIQHWSFNVGFHTNATLKLVGPCMPKFESRILICLKMNRRKVLWSLNLKKHKNFKIQVFELWIQNLVLLTLNPESTVKLKLECRIPRISLRGPIFPLTR